MGTEFNEQIGYANFTQDTDSATTFSATDTFTPLVLSIDDTFATATTISNEGSTFRTNSSGIYLVQKRLSVTGGSNAEYTMEITLNNVALSYTTMSFTTKGTNIWELQNFALIDMSTNDIDEKGFGTSVNRLGTQVKCTSGTNTLTLKNASFVLIRIQ
tara:strand:- start:1909 stop:2382 length:474 start_codon:yes stop_codon:yes gene_type:complete